MINITEITNLEELKNRQIYERACQSKVERSRQFLACITGIEVGYLSFDNRFDIDTGVLYDLLVLPSFRCRGVGKALVEAGEKVAHSLGHKKVRVLPKAFDNSVDQKWLTSWYEKLDYKHAYDGTQEYEKNL